MEAKAFGELSLLFLKRVLKLKWYFKSLLCLSFQKLYIPNLITSPEEPWHSVLIQHVCSSTMHLIHLLQWFSGLPISKIYPINCHSWRCMVEVRLSTTFSPGTLETAPVHTLYWPSPALPHSAKESHLLDFLTMLSANQPTFSICLIFFPCFIFPRLDPPLCACSAPRGLTAARGDK